MELKKEIKLARGVNKVIEIGAGATVFIGCFGAMCKGMLELDNTLEHVGVPEKVRAFVIFPTAFVAGMGVTKITHHVVKKIEERDAAELCDRFSYRIP